MGECQQARSGSYAGAAPRQRWKFGAAKPFLGRGRRQELSCTGPWAHGGCSGVAGSEQGLCSLWLLHEPIGSQHPEDRTLGCANCVYTCSCSQAVLGMPIKRKEPKSLQNCSNPSTRAQHPQHPPSLGRSWEGISAGRLPLQHHLVSAFPNPKLIWTNNGSGYPNNLRPAGEIITASPEASAQRVIMRSTAG